MQNERGSALIIVLLSLTILVTLGTVLLAQTISTAKQREQTSSTYEATYLAEYGVKYVEEYIESYMEKNEPTGDVETFVKTLVHSLKQELTQPIQIGEEKTFTIQFDDGNYDGGLELPFVITGTDEKKEKTLEATFQLQSASFGGDELDWLEDASDYWLDESEYPWLTERETYPSMPLTGVTESQYVNWKKENVDIHDNLIFKNGSKIQNSSIKANEFYSQGWVDSSQSTYQFDDVSTLQNGGTFSHDTFSSKGLFTKNSLTLTQSSFSINGPTEAYNWVKFDHTDFSSTSFYAENWIDGKNATLTFSDYVYLQNGGTLKNTEFSSGDLYAKNSFEIENTKMDIDGFGHFHYLELGQNTEMNINGHLFVQGQLNTHNNSELKACGNATLKSGTNSYGDFQVGQHLYVHNRLGLKNGSIITGGSLYANGGMDIQNGSGGMTIGGDLIINQKAGSSTINTSKDIVVLGDLVLLNVKKSSSYMFSLKNQIFVTGDILIYYEGEANPVVNDEFAFHTPDVVEYQNQKKFSKGTIVYHYPNEETIEIDGCESIPSDSNEKILGVELDHVEYE